MSAATRKIPFAVWVCRSEQLLGIFEKTVTQRKRNDRWETRTFLMYRVKKSQYFYGTRKNSACVYAVGMVANSFSNLPDVLKFRKYNLLPHNDIIIAR